MSAGQPALRSLDEIKAKAATNAITGLTVTNNKVTIVWPNPAFRRRPVTPATASLETAVPDTKASPQAAVMGTKASPLVDAKVAVLDPKTGKLVAMGHTKTDVKPDKVTGKLASSPSPLASPSATPSLLGSLSAKGPLKHDTSSNVMVKKKAKPRRE